jgi:hypothetical protein
VGYKQHCRIAGASTADQRNVLLMCPACHFNITPAHGSCR